MRVLRTERGIALRRWLVRGELPGPSGAWWIGFCRTLVNVHLVRLFVAGVGCSNDSGDSDSALETGGAPIVVVDQVAGFNEGGEQKMATRWLEALDANWPSEGGECDQWSVGVTT